VWVNIANGLYQALGRPKEATVLGLSRQVICLIPIVFILSKVFGINGLACAQAVADLCSMLIAIPMVAHQSRIVKRLKDGDPPPPGYGLSKAVQSEEEDNSL
jgi:Na+-driven multidrug efflux pump